MFKVWPDAMWREPKFSITALSRRERKAVIVVERSKVFQAAVNEAAAAGPGVDFEHGSGFVRERAVGDGHSAVIAAAHGFKPERAKILESTGDVIAVSNTAIAINPEQRRNRRDRDGIHKCPKPTPSTLENWRVEEEPEAVRTTA